MHPLGEKEWDSEQVTRGNFHTLSDEKKQDTEKPVKYDPISTKEKKNAVPATCLYIHTDVCIV